MFRYLALGDSMSIDTYPHLSDGVRGFPSLLVQNDDERFPEFRSRDLRTMHGAVAHENFAFDGATSVQVLSVQLPRAASHLAEGVDLVTLTIGGNDLLTHGLSLMGEHARMSASDVLVSFDGAAADFGSRLREILGLLKPRASNVLVGTIYDPTDGTGRFTDSTYAAMFGALLSPAATTRMLDAWNATIASATLDMGAQLIDVCAHFLGHGDHHVDSEHPRHDTADPSGWLFQTIEPNGRGASELRRLFLDTLTACGC